MYFPKFHFNLKKTFTLFFLIFTLCLFAFDPVAGGEEKNTLQSTSVLGGQASVTGGPFSDSIPGTLAVNPALGGAEQRPILDISYFLLAGLGKEEQGFGHTANLAVLYPTRVGNFAGSLHFLNSEFDSLKLGTMGGVRFSYSKELTEKFLVGVGAYSDFGKSWGLGADLGILYKFGDLSIFKDSKLGISLTGMGKTYNSNGIGIKGGVSNGSPAMFTPRAGFASTFVAIDGFKLGMHLDISLPFFQNFVFNTGLHLEMADMISLKTAFVLNALEAKYKKQTFIPSFNLGVAIKINSGGNNAFMKKQGWEKNDLKPEFSAKPFYNEIWAFGAGVNMHFGLKDSDPPKIDLSMPQDNTVYFSPNNDGENDAMEIPLKITDKRYVTSWSAEIKDSNENIVRTISNKIPLREMKDAKSFIKLLGKFKEAVDVPPVLRWDGRTDAGEIAADGKYTFVVKAEDDNHNKAVTENYVVELDRTPPIVELKQPESAANLIFSPDGDGNKDVFTFENTGSKEDLWTAVITDASGKTVKKIEVKNSELKPISWDGKDDSGQPVPDGIYKYTVEAVDRAKNRTVKSLSNIIIDTNKPAVNIAIDKKAFSPESSSNGTITFTPYIPSVNGLNEWNIEVKDEKGNTVKKYRGEPAKIEKIDFDGKNEKGTVLPEGKYKAFISAMYINGHNPKMETPSFIIDTTAPAAKVSASDKIFSPDGDGLIDSVIFSQEEISKGNWTAEIYKTDDKNTTTGLPIFKTEFGNLPSQFEWTGRKDDGSFAEDGKYIYVLKGEDEAGNKALSNKVIVELNTEKADIILQSNYSAFSPNGDKIKDTLELYPVIKSLTKVDKYKVTIKDASGKAVKIFEGAEPPKKLIWNGTDDENTDDKKGSISADGKYSAELEVELANKQSAKSIIPEIEIDTEFPKIKISAPYLVFSASAENKKSVLPINQISSEEKKWVGYFIDSKNKKVKTETWEGKAENLNWKADDDLGNKVPDGKYSYIIEAEDDAGNKTVQKLENITVDSREAKGYITAKLPVFSPIATAENIQELTIFTNIDAELDNWNITVSSVETGKTLAEWNSQKEKTLPKKLNWNGKDLKTGKDAEDGRYMASMYAEYKKGDIVTAFTEPFVVSTKPAKLAVNTSPKYFSPDNDGIDDDLFIKLKVETLAGVDTWSFEIKEPEENGGKLFWKTSGKEKITNQLIWDGRSLSGETVQSATDYPFIFTVTDKTGITSVYRGYIPVDILVIRDGDKLKIAVPSIIFRANAADFKGLKEDIVSKNDNILKRVAEILNKFPEYQVQVEGHANTTTGTEREEKNDLIPLSGQRAEAVRQILIKNGVRAARLSSVGMGSSKPIASINDKDNWWKNRRVEFVLIKHK